ncbi:uncharacterized protein LOC105833131 [Monomorium pharaonis]|uniref:uncharacterized protein LOC105833131 n=1 Tax=Monomorium pharaonis TaxID=307658 RepID=UPI0017476C34|nr:uncharacterized protein LOC105833131 [Monomorium pharaonis]
MVDVLRAGNESREYENCPLLYSDAIYNVRDFISREDNESLAKSYGDGSPNEICVFKLDQGKIDELANDYHAETCVPSFSHESAIQKESCEEAVKSDGAPSRNEDESRCKSNRKRKTRRKMPDGVIIDLSGDVCSTLRGGMKISIISMHNPIPEMKFVTLPKKQYSTMRNFKSPKIRAMKKVIDNSIHAVQPYAENCSERENTRRSMKRKCKNYSGESTTVNAHVEDNVPSLSTPNEVLGSTQCCHHHDSTPVDDIDNARYPILNTGHTCVDARERIADYRCSIFNDRHQEYHIYDRENYNVDGSDINAEVQADWTAVCFHPEHTRAKGCRCFCEFSSECESDINMQRDRCLPTSRAARELFENSALPKKHQREEAVRGGSGGLRTDIAPEFATEPDEYSSDGIERCANCDDGKKESWTSRKRVASRASVLADLCDSPRPASRCEIDTRPGQLGSWTTTTAVERDGGDRSYKSDSLKGVDTRMDARARRDNCIGRVVADSPSRSDRRCPGEKGGFAREVDSEWKPGCIETDAQQLDYKWKGRIATVDADGTRARVDFKGKHDSRYKSEEAIRVQLRESAEIRKHESLETAEATLVPA